jgi:hypothetical protein
MQCPVYFAKKLVTFYDRKTCRGLDLSLFDEVTFRFHVKNGLLKPWNEHSEFAVKTAKSQVAATISDPFSDDDKPIDIKDDDLPF